MRLRLIHSFLQPLISRYSSLLPFRVSPFAHCRVRTSRPQLITSSNFPSLSSSHSSDLLGPHISSGVGICMHTIQFCEPNNCLPFNLFGTLKILSFIAPPPSFAIYLFIRLNIVQTIRKYYFYLEILHNKNGDVFSKT